jgi:hypothetical protein
MSKTQNFKRYPHSGYSPYLMEYFYIVGYSRDKILNQTKIKELENSEPEILSVLNNSNQMPAIESEIILSQIFPNIPNFDLLNDPKSRPKKQTIIFALNPDDYNKPIKQPKCCCALIFYETTKSSSNNNKLYIPKAFCIVSQYPYFSFFNELNKKILDSFKKNLDIPIEIIIYNMLNYIPAPLNFDLELNIFPININNFNNNLTKEDKDKEKENDIKTSLISQASNCSGGSFHNNNNSFKLKQLTGYPLIDMDIIKLFNILPIEDVIEIFLLLLLEIDVIFFSKNLEILNPVMYILTKLTFPCDDTIFQWNIVTVSKSEFSQDNRFASRTGTIILGVNCSYDDSIEVLKIRQNNILVVDLDTNISNKSNKRIEFITSKEKDEDYEKINDFRNFIKTSIFPNQNQYNYFILNKNQNNLNFFYNNFIKGLYHNLYYFVYQNKNSILHNPLNLNPLRNTERNTISYNNYNFPQNVNYENFNNNNNYDIYDFFEYIDQEKIYKSNKEIQEVFYNFMLRLLSLFHSFFKLKNITEKNIDISDEKSSFFIKCSDPSNNREFFESRYNSFNEFEKLFYDLFIKTIRYVKFFLGFIIKFDSNKMHKFANQFSEEYMYILKSDAVCLNIMINHGKITYFLLNK